MGSQLDLMRNLFSLRKEMFIRAVKFTLRKIALRLSVISRLNVLFGFCQTERSTSSKNLFKQRQLILKLTVKLMENKKKYEKEQN